MKLFKKERSQNDQIFGFEEVAAPIEAEIAFHRCERSWWENNWVLIGVALAMALLDMMFLFDMLDLAMVQNEMLGRIGAMGVALVLNFLPLVIAKQTNKARYNLDNKSWLFALIGLGVFTIFYAGVVLLRFNCLELYMSSVDKGLLNTAGAVSNDIEVLDYSQEARRRAIFTAFLLSVEPLATSGFSFILAILTDNPLKKKIEYLETRLGEIRAASNRVSAALASMWEDKDFLLQNDAKQLSAARGALISDAGRLRAEARMMLAEKLGDPSSISAMSVVEKNSDLLTEHAEAGRLETTESNRMNIA